MCSSPLTPILGGTRVHTDCPPVCASRSRWCLCARVTICRARVGVLFCHLCCQSSAAHGCTRIAHRCVRAAPVGVSANHHVFCSLGSSAAYLMGRVISNRINTDVLFSYSLTCKQSNGRWTDWKVGDIGVNERKYVHGRVLSCNVLRCFINFCVPPMNTYGDK